ncbi:MAG: hypothetical protein WA705_15615 [Candidatus Ozemobacteraceae bacterium]
MQSNWMKMLALSGLFLFSLQCFSKTGITFSLNWGNIGFQCSDNQLEETIDEIEKQREQKFNENREKGFYDVSIPFPSLPSWARCQEIALKTRPEIVLVRMHLAASKVAMALMSQRGHDPFDDSLTEGLPFRFDPEDWGRYLAQRALARAHSKEGAKRIISHLQEKFRMLFSDVRDRINRDVVWAHHELGRLPATSRSMERNRAMWKLLFAMGFPESVRP